MVLQNSTLLFIISSKTKHLLSESLVAEDRHYSRDNLALDPDRPAIIDPLIEEFIVIEELCDYEVRACIHLLFKVANVVLKALGFQMFLGVASYTDAEIVSIFLSDELYQVNCIVETIFDGNPVGLALGRVTSQSKQIANTELLCLKEIR